MSINMQVAPLDTKKRESIQQIIDQKTKPLGALGQLEDIASQLALIQSQQNGSLATNIQIKHPSVLVFAGDHGIAEEGISIAPSAVTRQMVQNFIHGGAAINCFCRANNLDFTVIDAGIIEPLKQTGSNFIAQRLGKGTHNFAKQPAMSMEQVEQGLSYGAQAVKNVVDTGCNLIILGEMGIGNTSAAAAILAAITGADIDNCVGIGTGIDNQQLVLKKQLIIQALQRFDSSEPKVIMAEVGGFEIVQMTGAIIAAAQAGITLLVDGFIVSSAALLACKLQPNVRDYLIFAHHSQESGHQLLLQQLDAKPLLDLGLRLGEGTGAALALPLLTAACHFYNDMASFESAGVVV